MTFTFPEGLNVQVLPNGDVQQSVTEKQASSHQKAGGTLTYVDSPAHIEKYRVVTRRGHVVRYMQDENIMILFADGTVTYTDKRKGIWATINTKGIRRVRKINEREVYDHKTLIEMNEKIDPETNSTIQTRKDGVLIIRYENGTKLVVHKDGTEILT